MIDGKTRVCGIMANPVEHSYSPMMQNFFAGATGVNLAYVPLKVESGMVEEAVKGAYAMNLLGMNVTVPYKQQVMPFLKEIDEGAAAIGAVNTLVRMEGGYKGYNTDAPGLYRAMAEEGISIEGEECILLGAGGAGKAAAYTLGVHGAKRVYLLNRNRERAVSLAEEMNGKFGREVFFPMGLEEYGNIPEGSYLCIQSTSVGMAPKTEEAPIEDETFYRKIHTGFDIVYTPFETRFMKLVKQAGGRAYNGLSMLIYQGVIANELWNPAVKVSPAAVKEIRCRMEEKLAGRDGNVILIGFMGAGKTTVGQAYASRYGKEFLDTDALIEARAGKTINAIFAEEGEEAFRRMETETVREIGDRMRNTVVSVGGGLPLREENRRLLKAAGTVVYLKSRPETVCERLKGDDTRPMLKGHDPEKRVRELLAAREAAYLDACHFSVDTDGRTQEELAEFVYGLVNREEEA